MIYTPHAVKVRKLDAIAWLVTVVSTLFAVFLIPAYRHWFVVPLLVLALLLIPSFLDWIRGKVDLYDVRGQVSALGIYFFFLAPFLHVGLDFWIPNVVAPGDWRHWLGLMAIVNCFGMAAFLRASRQRRDLRQSQYNFSFAWSKFWLALGVLSIVSIVLQTYVYQKFGGVAGYMQAALDDAEFSGLGLLFTFSESFPTLASIGFVVLARKRGWSSWKILFFALLVFLCLKLIFGGLRGSRSNTIWGVYFAVGVIHLFVRPIPRKLIGLGLALLFMFMVAYSYVKSFGAEGVAALTDRSLRQTDRRYGGDPVTGVLLVDFSRSDVQAYILNRQFGVSEGFDYAYGRTYLYAATMVVPFRSGLFTIEGKRKEGTIALYGQGQYMHGTYGSTRLHGLGGEALLNFGIPGVILAYIVFGVVTRRLQGFFLDSPSMGDVRRLAWPFVANLVILALIADSDNIVFYLIKNGLPILILFVVSLKVTRDRRVRVYGGP